METTDAPTIKLTRLYRVFQEPPKSTRPLREWVADAIDRTRAAYPAATPTVLLLNPVHLPALGTWTTIDGQTWMCSYNRFIGPREVRVGPVD